VRGEGGLEEVVLRAAGEDHRGGGVVVPGGDHRHREGDLSRRRGQGVEELDAVHVGEEEVQQDAVDAGVPAAGQPFGAGGGFQDRVLPGPHLEQAAHDFAISGRVLDDEDGAVGLFRHSVGPLPVGNSIPERRGKHQAAFQERAAGGLARGARWCNPLEEPRVLRAHDEWSSAVGKRDGGGAQRRTGTPGRHMDVGK
jgi:hypothetical protein